jgi:hypothetical protein
MLDSPAQQDTAHYVFQSRTRAVGRRRRVPRGKVNSGIRAQIKATSKLRPEGLEHCVQLILGLGVLLVIYAHCQNVNRAQSLPDP